jgi:hypothetical protein
MRAPLDSRESRTLFQQSIDQAQAAARAWPVSVIERETEATHDRPGQMETHMVCREGGCDQSVFRLIPISLDAAGAPIDQAWIISVQPILDSIAAHIRQCHDPATRM